MIVDVMLPSGGGDQLAIPQRNLSISGYEPDSLSNSHIRSPAVRAQEISIMHNWMGQHLSQQEILSEEECRKIPDMRDENISKEAHMCKEPPYQEGVNIQEKVVKMKMIIEGYIEIKDPLMEGGI